MEKKLHVCENKKLNQALECRPGHPRKRNERAKWYISYLLASMISNKPSRSMITVFKQELTVYKLKITYVGLELTVFKQELLGHDPAG